MRKVYACLLLTLFGMSCSLKRETNWSITLERNGKEPYGCYIAYQCLKDLFPTTPILSSKNPLQSIRNSNKRGGQGELVVIVCETLFLDSLGWEDMQTFLQNGNDVVIFSSSLPSYIQKDLKVHVTYSDTSNEFEQERAWDTTQRQSLDIEFYEKKYEFGFKGYPLLGYYQTDSMNEDQFTPWGHVGKKQKVNLLTWYHQGSLTLCGSSLVMSNYFLLQENNREYYERLFSTYRDNVQKITWSSGAIIHTEGKGEDMWDLLWKTPGLLYCFIILLGLLLIYIGFESKRRQRLIPILDPNTNSSLEFTETIGRLYYNKRDHGNLVKKMLQHYLEHIRAKYLLPTNELNEAFAVKLSAKLNQPLSETKAFLAYLEYIRSSSDVSDTDIIHLHRQLKKYS